MRTTAALLLAIATLLPTLSSARDLVYSHSGSNNPVLKEFDQQPWWKLFANCAGLYTAALNQAQDPVLQDRFSQEGIHHATLGSLRVASDNGLEMTIQKRVVDLAEARTAEAEGNGLMANAEYRERMLGMCDALPTTYASLVPDAVVQ